MHPTPENLPSARELASVIGTDTLSEHQELDQLARRLRRASTILRIGDAEGSDDAIFGLVEDVAADARGRILVLDSQMKRLRIYSQDGRLVFAVGRGGEGPYEFQAPEALDLDSQGQVLVADRFNKVKIFGPQEDSVEYLDVVRLELVPEDMCALGDRFFVQAWHSSETVIHEYSSSGLLRSFGDPYRTANPLVQNQLSDGPIGCSRAGLVLMMPKYLPFLHAYDSTRTRRWVSRIEAFTPLQITEQTGVGGRPEVAFKVKGPFHVAHTITALHDQYVLVQVARSDEVSVRQRAEYASLQSYVIDAASGDGVYLGDHLPTIFAGNGNRLYGAVSDPFPQVHVLRF